MPILLDDVLCLGNESNLLQCNHSEIRKHDCFHLEDLGVSCGKSILYIATV